MTTGYRVLAILSLSMVGLAIGAAQSGTVGGSVAAASPRNVVDGSIDNGAEPGDSHVRIVRLSEVQGKLALDRRTGLGFEQTMPNMPIVEGEKLRTGDGYAEVEFEDNSTLRLAPESQVNFDLLALRSSGAKASLMDVRHGTVYVNTESTKGNEFLLRVGEMKLTVAPSTHLRLQVGDGKTVLSVMNGSVDVVRNGETKTVGRKETMTVGTDQVTMANKVASEPFDAWDKESNDYHQRYAMANTYAGGGNAYGLSDLNYYGNFINAGGYGQIWQPYLAGADWSPYGNGLWAFYPGAGLLVGVALSVGMAAVSLGSLEFLSGIWMGMAAGRIVDGFEQYWCGWFCAGGNYACRWDAGEGCGACSDAACGTGAGCRAGAALDGAVEPDADGLLS
ncbi:MAG: FecR family protein [Edaphobacter sp.]